MTNAACEIGVIGLGTMGRNLLLNIAEHGHAGAGLDKDASKVDLLGREAGKLPATGTTNAADFVQMLRPPRAVLLLVPAGAPVDSVIAELKPLMTRGDLIIDGGNSHFTDTDARAKKLTDSGIQFVGMGISGGEAGARHGPSLMPGGPRPAYERMRPILEDIAARVSGDPCVAWLGPGSAGHYVKMVHNGIEYGLMQLIAECYDVLHRGAGLTIPEIQAVFAEWRNTELNSFLIEITADVLAKKDDQTGRPLVDVILDVARQKGTGQWTSQAAMEVQTPIPTIDAAVSMRALSAAKEERIVASRIFAPGPVRVYADKAGLSARLRRALFAATMVTYAQGLSLLQRAKQALGYAYRLEDVARIWRGGCIIRAAVLEDMRSAFVAHPDLTNLLLAPAIAAQVAERAADLRAVANTASELRVPAAAFMASLGYLDALCSARLPANLTQAQRDYFGAHTYERIDQPGTFHTDWS